VLHAPDPSTVFLSVAGASPKAGQGRRSHGASPYDRRRLVRMLGMQADDVHRARDLVPVVQAAATDAIAKVERAAGRCSCWRRRVSPRTARVAFGTFDDMTMARARETGRGDRRRDDQGVPLLRTQVLLAEESAMSRGRTSPAGSPGAGTEGRLVRGRPLGSWVSSQYRWAPADKWLPRGSLAGADRGPGGALLAVAAVVRRGHSPTSSGGPDGRRRREARPRSRSVLWRSTSTAPPALVLRDDQEVVRR